MLTLSLYCHVRDRLKSIPSQVESPRWLMIVTLMTWHMMAQKVGEEKQNKSREQLRDLYRISHKISYATGPQR
ncbi:hypothetical protein AFLA_005009 [Aspergillus flavus NRRL3357]|nr:hypothetical protein AFLA_005009 [Aspergillus flavus NRRL3357]